MDNEPLFKASTESDIPLVHWEQQQRRVRKLQLIVFSLCITNLVTFGVWLITLQRVSTWHQGNIMNHPRTAYLGTVRAPVVYETRRYHTGMRAGDVTEFFGPAGDRTADAAWMSILDTPLTRLTKAQAAQLGTETAKEWNATGSYVGIIGAFHQLHCLSYIRSTLSHTNGFGDYDEHDPAKKHVLHCMEYLRQSIMCLGDVTVEPVGFEESSLTYMASVEPLKQCRKFDVLYNWSKEESQAIPAAPGNAKLAGKKIEF